MSLVSILKEFTDVLQQLLSNQLENTQHFQQTEIASTTSEILQAADLRKAIQAFSESGDKFYVLQKSLLFLLQNIGTSLIYLLSFQWLRDLSYLPLVAPETVQSSLISFSLTEEADAHLFSLAKMAADSFNTGGRQILPSTFLTALLLLRKGFCNSFFFSLPFSLPHLITIRRLFSEGVVAAGASILGTVVAHSVFLVAVLFGVRFLLIPYVVLQPFTLFIGFGTVVFLLTELLQEKRMYLLSVQATRSNPRFFLRIALLNLLLALCEETTFFHSFNHLTLNRESTFLEFFSGSTALNSFFATTTYFFAFVLGHLLFSFGFCYLLLKANEQLCSFTGWTLPRIIRRINKFLLLLILTLTFCSFPYYGLDYLVTKIAGFLPQDPILRQTIFSPTMVSSKNLHFKSTAPPKPKEKTAFEIDLNYFDRALYLNATKQEKEFVLQDSKALFSKLSEESEAASKEENQEQLEGKEDLQSFDSREPFQLESDSPRRSESTKSQKVLLSKESGEALQGKQKKKGMPSFSEEDFEAELPILSFEELNYQADYAWLMRHERARNLPEEEENGKFSLFQEPKTHFKELRLQKENRQAEAALQKKSASNIFGHISEQKEGSLPAEMTALPNKSFPQNFKALPIDLSSRTFRTEKLTNAGRVAKEDESSASSLQKKSSLESEIAFTYSQSFTSPFAEEAENTPSILLPIESIIKKRYLLNPMYRSLLTFDIDTFLARQPSTYKIAQNQEYNLFKKRQLLNTYYNCLRYYSPSSVSDFVEDPNYSPSSVFDFVDDPEKIGREGESQDPSLDTEEERLRTLPKSLVDALYHHQFKGTLTRAERLFKVTFDDEQNPEKRRVLAYDQTLYKDTQKQKDRNKRVLPKTSGEKTESVSLFSDKSVKQNPFLHEELLKEQFISPFVEESNSVPMYAGWDDTRHGFVITNRFTSQELIKRLPKNMPTTAESIS